MSETVQEIIYYVIAALAVGGAIYGLYRAKKWAAGARARASEDLDRFTEQYGFEVDEIAEALRGTVDGIDLVLDRGGIGLTYMGKGGRHKLLRVTATGGDPQRWYAVARFMIEKMMHPPPETGRELLVEGDPEFNEALLLRAESEAAVPFLGFPELRAAVLEHRLRLARVGDGKVELSFDFSSFYDGAALASFDELEGALLTTMAVCRPAEAARYLE